MNGFQYQNVKAKQSKQPSNPVSSLASTETFRALCHFAKGSDSIMLFSKKPNHWQTLEILCSRLNQDRAAHVKCALSFTTHKRTAAVQVDPRNKAKHWERSIGHCFSLKLHRDHLSPELLHSFPTCPTIQGNILLRSQFS